jgi:hypothetical protein
VPIHSTFPCLGKVAISLARSLPGFTARNFPGKRQQTPDYPLIDSFAS